MDPDSTIDVGGRRADTGALAKQAASILEQVRQVRADHLAPLTDGGSLSMWTSRALNEAERHALVAQRYCVQSLTARLRSDDDEVDRLAAAAEHELRAAREILAGLDVEVAEQHEDVASAALVSDESEVEAASHLDDDPHWSAPAARSVETDESRPAEVRSRPEPEQPVSPASQAPPDHEPITGRSSTIVEEVEEPVARTVMSDAEAEVVPTSADRARRSRRNRKLVTFALVAIVIIGLVLVLSGSSVFD